MRAIPKKKLSQEVLERLVGAIASGEFPPHTQLPSERELMERTGVGRPSIREALQTLQQMGLVTISHGERARVNEPTPGRIITQISAAMVTLLATAPDGLDELKEVRLFLEGGLARVAAERVKVSDLRALDAALEAMREARGDHERFVRADMRFHVQIGAISGNSIIAAVVDGMLDWLSSFKRDLVSVPGAEELTLAEHRRIRDAIAGNDADAAQAAMHEHLSRANELYSRIDQLRRAGAGSDEPTPAANWYDEIGSDSEPS